MRHSNHELTDRSLPDEIWTCSMHPEVRESEPGVCPKCGSPLVLQKRAGLPMP